MMRLAGDFMGRKLGHKVSKETRKKISLTLKGRRVSPETEFKTGQRAANWNGFKKGHIPSSKGKKTGIIPKTAFKKGCGTGSLKLKKWRENGGTPWNKGKKMPETSGKNHHNWKGGVTKDYIRFSFEYRMWRWFIFERDSYTCQICGKKGGKLQADHIKPQALFPELILDVDNGRTLCVECHRGTDTYGYKTAILVNQISNDEIGG